MRRRLQIGFESRGEQHGRLQRVRESVDQFGQTGRVRNVRALVGVRQVVLARSDPSKVDRSGAYFCRYVARTLVQGGLAKKAEVQVAYAIGRAKPLSIKVDTFGTSDAALAERFVATFNFKPAAIIQELDLLRPIYRATTNYGHFGKAGLPWERSVVAASV